MAPSLHRLPELGRVDWAPLVGAVRAAPRLALVTHVAADTDGIGSELALHRHFVAAGREARILNPDPLPPHLRFLDPDRAVESYRPGDAAFLLAAAVVVLDVSDRRRLGAMAEPLERHPGPVICIDHHANERHCFGSHEVIEPRAPSTGTLVAELLQAMGAAIDPGIAEALYATIVADTGGFRFSNTSSHVLRLAADLVDLGADPQRVYRGVLASYRLEKVRLLGQTLGGATVECGGRLAWYRLTRAAFAETGASPGDIDGLVEYLRLPDGVQVAVLLVEQAERRVKVSFRSEPGLDVNRLAARWGGGGHLHAAGATIDGPLEAVAEQVVATVKRELFG
jgi:phosphoesterase RecJ-like protein